MPPLGPPPTPDDIARVYRMVCKHLPASYDREFVADTIVVAAWIKGIPTISQGYIRHKCISAWRTHNRESRRNRASATEPIVPESTERATDRKNLIEDLMRSFPPAERRLIWMRFWNDQTLEEIAKNTGLPRTEVQAKLKEVLYKMRIILT